MDLGPVVPVAAATPTQAASNRPTSQFVASARTSPVENPYKKPAKVAKVSPPLGSAMRKQAPVASMPAEVASKPAVKKAAAKKTKQPLIIDLVGKANSRCPFKGKDYLKMGASDVVFDLVRFRCPASAIDPGGVRSRRARVKQCLDAMLLVTPTKLHKYMDPFKAPKVGLSTFEERDEWLKMTSEVAQTAVMEVNHQRLDFYNSLLKRKDTTMKSTISRLSSMIEATKQEFDPKYAGI